MTVNHNHANYQSRFENILQILADHLHLPSNELPQVEITPIQYEIDHPFKYNNFVYRLLLPSDIIGLQQPGCDEVPAGTREFIIRLSNPDSEAMYHDTRIKNEVAILSLAQDALNHINPPVIPRVFGWGSMDHDHTGWILQELMPGEPLAEAFDSMSLHQKKMILEQIALFLKALQDYQLPNSIHGIGGADFSAHDTIVSGPLVSVGAGPWHTLEESCRQCLKVALAKSDINLYLQGWNEGGLRKRINQFILHGLPALMLNIPMKQEKSIIHGDIVPENLLYDPTTNHITALLDFDFASIQHPAYEFFQSFGSSGGQFPGWSTDKDAEELRKSKLTGVFPSPLPTQVASWNGPGIDWEVAQAWEEVLQKIDVKRPSNIPGFTHLADIDELVAAVLPWRLENKDFLSMNQDEDERRALKRMEEEKLGDLLDHLGF